MSDLLPRRRVTPTTLKLGEYVLQARLYAGAIVGLGFFVAWHARSSRTELSFGLVLGVLAAFAPLVPFMWEGRAGISRADTWRWFFSRPLPWKLGWLGIFVVLVLVCDVSKHGPHHAGDFSQLLGMFLVFAGYYAVDMAAVIVERVQAAKAHEAMDAALRRDS